VAWQPPRAEADRPRIHVYPWRVVTLLLLTNSEQSYPEVLPALGLLMHRVRVGPANAAALLARGRSDDLSAVLVDCRRDLAAARTLTRLLSSSDLAMPLIGVVTEGGISVVTLGWGLDEVVLDNASPAEVDARLRLAIERSTTRPEAEAPDVVHRGDLLIDEASYQARLLTRQLDLTFKEFELLKFLAQHENRVFTRNQLLHEVWGYDYFGGTRTVDVHVRRLRAKLGPEHEQLIGTVRNVGYRFVTAPRSFTDATAESDEAEPDGAEPERIDDATTSPRRDTRAG
jgi:DNA-binding response OmpR family regulator